MSHFRIDVNVGMTVRIEAEHERAFRRIALGGTLAEGAAMLGWTEDRMRRYLMGKSEDAETLKQHWRWCRRLPIALRAAPPPRPCITCGQKMRRAQDLSDAKGRRMCDACREQARVALA